MREITLILLAEITLILLAEITNYHIIYHTQI